MFVQGYVIIKCMNLLINLSFFFARWESKMKTLVAMLNERKKKPVAIEAKITLQ